MSAAIRRISAGEPKSTPMLLTVPEACSRLRVSRWTLYQLIRSGQLDTIKIGSSRRVPVTAIGELVDRLRQAEDR